MGNQNRLYPGIHECCEPYCIVLTEQEINNIMFNGKRNPAFMAISLNKINQFLTGCLMWKD